MARKSTKRKSTKRKSSKGVSTPTAKASSLPLGTKRRGRRGSGMYRVGVNKHGYYVWQKCGHLGVVCRRNSKSIEEGPAPRPRS